MFDFKILPMGKFLLGDEEEAVPGGVACMDTANGVCVADAAGSTSLLAFGRFAEEMTGDGLTTRVRVEFFSPKRVVPFTNSSAPNNVTADDIGKLVYLAGSGAVTTDDAGNSPAGRCWLIEDGRVWVEAAADMGPTGPQGPQGEPGA